VVSNGIQNSSVGIFSYSKSYARKNHLQKKGVIWLLFQIIKEFFFMNALTSYLSTSCWVLDIQEKGDMHTYADSTSIIYITQVIGTWSNTY